MKHVLVIEDNVELAFGLENNLEIEGYRVTLAHDGVTGLDAALAISPDLIILDLTLPELDGFRVLKGVRASGSEVPILILTARGEETDKVRGLRFGADDYVTKPFGLLELLARTEALLRRASAGRPTQDVDSFGEIVIDRAARTVTRAGEVVALSPKEYDLLIALAARGEGVVSRMELMREVWGYADSAISRTIDTHIAELRRKLETTPRSPKHIVTVTKVGYRLRRNDAR